VFGIVLITQQPIWTRKKILEDNFSASFMPHPRGSVKDDVAILRVDQPMDQIPLEIHKPDETSRNLANPARHGY
jgi:hypothetical protein